ncbi:MAG: hemerythrin domain-containing protein, partial [Gammaproteobacteria bacterium]|nr:hemerythrin domain-containing protein [Gammaproteobacteria bacterium]
MHKLIEQLQRYHAEKARVLADLQSLNGSLAETDDPSAVLLQLTEILQGFDGSAETEHHHNEELILAELRKTDAPIHRRVEEITGDHKAFSKILARLLDQLEENQDDLQLISSEISEFIKNYEDHANTE